MPRLFQIDTLTTAADISTARERSGEPFNTGGRAAGIGSIALTLRVFRGDDFERDRSPKANGQVGSGEAAALARFGTDFYYIIPSYGEEFQDIRRWERTVRSKRHGVYQLWPGFAGGGIVAVEARFGTGKWRGMPVFDVFQCGQKQVYGTVLGNPAASELAYYVACLVPERPPAIAVRFGVPRVPNPRVAATVEHANCLQRERFLLVVPREGRKSVKLIAQLPDWLASFGVKTLGAADEPRGPLRDEMRDWFGNPGRPMLAIQIEGGVDNAAWQLAVIYYVAEYWDTHARGLNSVHFVANIEGQPNFRKNWTSNK
jgi:hypothetical protein